MKLSAPSKLFFLISLVLLIIGLLGAFSIVGAISTAVGGYLVIAAWVVLALGCLLTGV